MVSHKMMVPIGSGDGSRDLIGLVAWVVPRVLDLGELAVSTRDAWGQDWKAEPTLGSCVDLAAEVELANG